MAQNIRERAIRRKRRNVAEKLMTNDDYFSSYETVTYQHCYIFLPIIAIWLSGIELILSSVYYISQFDCGVETAHNRYRGNVQFQEKFEKIQCYVLTRTKFQIYKHLDFIVHSILCNHSKAGGVSYRCVRSNDFYSL